MILLLYLLGCTTFKNDKVCFKNKCFYVELATTPQARSRGLMFRRHLDRNKGMLFLFDDERRHTFRMTNTLIPLDIIWINRNKEVVFIKQNAQTCPKEPCPRIRPPKNAKYILEVNAGVVKDTGLKIGDKIKF